MTVTDNVFFKCLGFDINKTINKPIFFYHVPKCGGTTFCVLLSHLFYKTHRLQGPLFQNNDKGGVTAYNNFLKNKEIIRNNKLNYLYGHVPFEIHNKLDSNNLFITLIREPIQRCVSHYTWAINRGYFSINDDIGELFEKNIIPKNAIVNQFSGIGLTQFDHNESTELAFNNLSKNIDLIFDVEDFYKLINLIISLYDLPNLFFQNQMVQHNKKEIPEKIIHIIKKYNLKDSALYSKLKKNKLIKNYNILNKKFRDKDEYLYSSPHLLLNNKKTLLVKKEKIIDLEKKLNKLDYKIITLNN